jgi:hypothetical protein
MNDQDDGRGRSEEWSCIPRHRPTGLAVPMAIFSGVSSGT